MIHNKYVDDYIRGYEEGHLLFNKERIQLVDYLKKSVLSDDTLHFDNEQIENCIKFSEKWFFKLQPFQKFLIAFVFLYHEDGTNYYEDFLWMMGRGSGKNGLISALGTFLISEFNGVRGYNGSIIANSEEQAKTSVAEIKDVVDSSPTLGRAFYATNTQIKSRRTNSTLKYRTSNGNTKDGLRDGFVIFDEIHEYQDDSNVKVHLSGLGKKANPRVFFIGTDGYVRDGFIDTKKKQAESVLKGKAAPDFLFPWICKIDSEDEIDNPRMWEKSVPMIVKPLSTYGKTLYRQIKKDYDALVEAPSGREEFLTKRMDYPSTSMNSSVAPWEEIAATNQPIPHDLDGREAIGAVDFASVRDFIAAAVTVRYKDKLVTIEKQWARKGFCDKYYAYSRKERIATPNQRINIPLHDWERSGLVEVIDEPLMDPKHALEWMQQMAQRFNIKKVVMDNYRAQIMRKMFEDGGFDVDIIYNPTSIDGLLASIIDDGFPRHRFIWGDNPMLRWNTQNVLVKVNKANGNKSYEKKEETRRKTDGFKAFEYTLYRANELSDVDVSESLAFLNDLDF
ncbi:Terminase [Lacticaseibacillus zeae DSM 20178 = KCTC 3804]|uniref:Terminase n=1 Tax=Lacticaseibacillus zeae DSM 20178 = KCTC 3804 TaxID=1423816 RepID=A0A0R1EXP3_LACZE|nr:terminase large subunit [Lacticaseibacillus zeae]KRK11834.1 Terminase [Lacticaseibacillus zeae DSM 20178 = KCTC 3804]